MSDDHGDPLPENVRRYPPARDTPAGDATDDSGGPEAGTHPEQVGHRGADRLERERMDRRRFLGWSALGGLAAVGAVAGYEETQGTGGPSRPRPSAARPAPKDGEARRPRPGRPPCWPTE